MKALSVIFGVLLAATSISTSYADEVKLSAKPVNFTATGATIPSASLIERLEHSGSQRVAGGYGACGAGGCGECDRPFYDNDGGHYCYSCHSCPGDDGQYHCTGQC